jgi:hypothetical protein
MGYYTKYTVKISGADDTNHLRKVLETLELHREYDETFSDDGRDVTVSTEPQKWYTWERECILVSKVYPKITIEVHGEGEETGDIWKARVRNGESEYVKAKIVFDPFVKLK